MNASTNATIPATRNAAFGFFGTMNELAVAAWPLAMTAISEVTDESLDAVRAFLDSSHGRHFADDVHNAMHDGLALAAAIDAATRRWMHFRLSVWTRRQYGLPAGLAYLTTFVIHCDITSHDA